MARLAKKSHPGDWSYDMSKGRDGFAKSETLFAELQATSRAVPLDGSPNDKSDLTGIVLQFPFADGYAHYVVIKNKPLTLQHIPFCDAWQVQPALIRGMRRVDIIDQELRARAIANRLAKKG